MNPSKIMVDLTWTPYVYMGLAFLGSIYLLRREVLRTGSAFLCRSKVKNCPLPFSDILLVMFVFLWCVAIGIQGVFLASVLVTLVVLCYALRNTDPLTYWGVAPFERRKVGQSVFSGIRAFYVSFAAIYLIVFIVRIISQLAGYDIQQDTVKKLKEEGDILLILGTFISVVIIAPLWEEIVFRGFLYPLMKKHYSREVALIGTSLFFGLMHGVGPMIPLTFLGVFFALSYESTGRLTTPIIFHMCFNLLNFCSIIISSFPDSAGA